MTSRIILTTLPASLQILSLTFKLYTTLSSPTTPPSGKRKGKKSASPGPLEELRGNNNSKSRHTDAAAVPVVMTAVHLALA